MGDGANLAIEQGMDEDDYNYDHPEEIEDYYSDPQWPTLKGRLSQPLTSELEALEQLERMVPLSEFGKKRLKNLKPESQSDKKSS